jgi:hypothetical protein
LVRHYKRRASPDRTRRVGCGEIFCYQKKLKVLTTILYWQRDYKSIDTKGTSSLYHDTVHPKILVPDLVSAHSHEISHAGSDRLCDDATLNDPVPSSEIDHIQQGDDDVDMLPPLAEFGSTRLLAEFKRYCGLVVVVCICSTRSSK